MFSKNRKSYLQESHVVQTSYAGNDYMRCPSVPVFPSSTRILFAYFMPCMHSFGSMTPRLLTISNLPFFAWAM